VLNECKSKSDFLPNIYLCLISFTELNGWNRHVLRNGVFHPRICGIGAMSYYQGQDQGAQTTGGG